MRSVRLSHLEIVVEDIELMEHFYTELLGFEVTDRSVGRGEGEMVFLSHDPDEHHQLVLRQDNRGDRGGRLDHIAFRIDSLADLRFAHESALAADIERIETVSHGSTWSIYLRDPEANRVEFFVDTPWPVSQPCRFDIDLSVPDDQLVAWTESHLSDQHLI